MAALAPETVNHNYASLAFATYLSPVLLRTALPYESSQYSLLIS